MKLRSSFTSSQTKHRRPTERHPAVILRNTSLLKARARDVHDHERGCTRVDARMGRLSIHAANNISPFLIGVWQRKFATRILRRHDDAT